MTNDEAKLANAAYGRRAIEEKLVTVFNAINGSGIGYKASFNYFYFDELPGGNEPMGAGTCFAWTAEQRSKMPPSGGGLTITEVSWRISGALGSLPAWTHHSAIRLEIDGAILFPNGKLTVGYIDNGWIGGFDHIFFQPDIPNHYWNETPGKLVDGSYAEHAGDPPKR